MKLVVGLGNPGPRYAETRHNVGFLIVDELARRWQAAVDHYDKRFEALIAETMFAEQRVTLMKPQTFMNLSGRSVSAFTRFFKLAPDGVVVIYDDMDLPPGRVRVRERGSAGGHNGMSDVIHHLSTENIARVRVGIGRVHGGQSSAHVLSKFDARDREEVAASIATAVDAVECWVREGVTPAMNRFNKKESTSNGDPAV